MSVAVITEPRTCDARSQGKLSPSSKWQIHIPGFRGGKLLSVTAVLCSVTLRFLQTIKIYGVVNNDLILFSMLVIYFKIYILVYFRL